MSKKYTFAGIFLILMILALRAIPFSANSSNPIIMLIGLMASIPLSYFVYRLYKNDLRDSGKNNGKFPIVMGFIAFIFLAIISTHLSKLTF